MDCFDSILISTEDLAYFISVFFTGSMLCSISCITCSKSMKSMEPNENIKMKWATVLYFVWEKVLFYTKVKVFILYSFLSITTFWETFFKLQE